MSSGNDKLERDLESFLSDDSRVAALYRRLPKDEPDAKLDAAILAQARSAVAPRRARPRWLPAMSAAAAIVIAAGLAYRVGPHVWNERSAVSEKAEQSVAAPPVPQKPPSDEAPQSTVSNAPIPQADKAAQLQTGTVAGTAIRRVDVEPARRAEADKLHAAKRKADDQKNTTSVFAKQSAQGAMQQEKDVARDSADAANAPAGATREEAQPRMKTLAEPPRLDAVPTSPAEASPAVPAAMAMPAPKPAAPEPKAFPTSAGAMRAAPAPPPAPVMQAPTRESAQSVVEVEQNLYPEHWISDIRQMLKDGHRDDAIRNLTAFRKRYPDYTLPDDLRDLK